MFAAAITCLPCQNAVDGLRAIDQGIPFINQMLADHANYCSVFASTGANVITLPTLPIFPDAHSVQDTALCLPERVIFMSPGAPSRLVEIASMLKDIAHLFPEAHLILPPAQIEGGDILITGAEIFVGASGRTNAEGIAALKQIVSKWSYHVRKVDMPPGVLHFKTECSVPNDGVVLSTQRLASSGCFSNYDVILTCGVEEQAANAIRFNNLVITPAGFPATRRRL